MKKQMLFFILSLPFFISFQNITAKPKLELIEKTKQIISQVFSGIWLIEPSIDTTPIHGAINSAGVCCVYNSSKISNAKTKKDITSCYPASILGAINGGSSFYVACAPTYPSKPFDERLSMLTTRDRRNAIKIR